MIISTFGIFLFINKLKKIDISSATSLHALNNIIRNEIMLINKKYNINNLLRIVYFYLIGSESNRSKVIIEYVLLY